MDEKWGGKSSCQSRQSRSAVPRGAPITKKASNSCASIKYPTNGWILNQDRISGDLACVWEEDDKIFGFVSVHDLGLEPILAS